jgi:hypothetical protein
LSEGLAGNQEKRGKKETFLIEHEQTAIQTLPFQIRGHKDGRFQIVFKLTDWPNNPKSRVTGCGIMDMVPNDLVGRALREQDLPRILGEFFPIIESDPKKLFGDKYICSS